MTVTRRAYSLLEIKEMDDETRVIRGIASTPSPDRMDDVVMPKGAKFNLPIPLLWQHNPDQPIGHVTEATITDKGIEVVAEIAKGITDEIERAWKLVKAGLVRGLSIGFRELKTEQIPNSWGVIFEEWEWLELSAVTIPANAEASITSVKKFDIGAPAASGTKPSVVDATPGASGKSHKPVNLRPKEGKDMKTLAEQITALEAKRAANMARMEEIQTKASEEGRTKDEAEREEFGTLADENDTIDEELKDLRRMEKAKAVEAKPVNKAPAPATTDAPARAAVTVKGPKAAPGIEFARLAKVKALAFLSQGERRQTEIAKQLYGENSAVYGIVSKASVVAGSSADGNWASDLVGDETSVYADFVEFLRPMTIVGKFGQNSIPSLRTVPFRTPLIGQTGGGQAYWVGEGKPKPLTAFDFNRNTLDELKVATISVVTEELLRKSSPAADVLLRDALAGAVAERVDTDFIDPSKSASAGVSPASITNGVSAITSSGNDADAIREDVRALMATFVAAKNPPTSGVWIMSSATALALSLMVNPLGQPEFPGINMNGGTFMGLPVIVSEYFAPVSAGGYVALVNASDIYFADEGGVMIDVSREASLQMLDNPTNDTVTPTATSMVSMWQTNSVAFRAERILNWSKRRASAVALLDEVNWGLPAASA